MRTSNCGLRGLLVSSIAASAALSAGIAGAAPCEPSLSTCSESMPTETPSSTTAVRDLGTGLNTGWAPEDFQYFQVRAGLDLGAPESGNTYEIALPNGNTITVVWGTEEATDRFLVSLNPPERASDRGAVLVAHDITARLGARLNLPETEISIPITDDFSIDIPFDVASLNFEQEFDVNDFLNLVPGSNLAYQGEANGNLVGWGFEPLTMAAAQVEGSSNRLASVTLFGLLGLVGVSLPEELTDLTGDFDIGIALNVDPAIDFTYQTTKVAIRNAAVATATPPEITTADGVANLEIVDADYLDVEVSPSGTLSFSGVGGISPVVEITAEGLLGVAFSFLGFDEFAITTWDDEIEEQSIDVNLAASTFRVPLPNVKLPNSTPPLTGTVGEETMIEIILSNTGLAEAIVELDPSSGLRVDDASIVIPPESDVRVEVSYTPSVAGNAEATITVISNDPDSPEQVLDLNASGQDAPISDAPPGAAGAAGGPSSDGMEAAMPPAAGDDGGCGCRVIGSASSTSGWGAALALGALGLFAFGRRRR